MPNKIAQKQKFNASPFEMKTFRITVDGVTDGSKKQTSIINRTLVQILK